MEADESAWTGGVGCDWFRHTGARAVACGVRRTPSPRARTGSGYRNRGTRTRCTGAWSPDHGPRTDRRSAVCARGASPAVRPRGKVRRLRPSARPRRGKRCPVFLLTTDYWLLINSSAQIVPRHDRPGGAEALLREQVVRVVDEAGHVPRPGHVRRNPRRPGRFLRSSSGQNGSALSFWFHVEHPGPGKAEARYRFGWRPLTISEARFRFG